MTFFEYVMVMVSIVLGLSLAQLLRGFGKFVRSERRELAVALWATVLVIMHLQVWWALWDMHTIDNWTQFRFYLLVSIPIFMFALSELLTPMGSAAATNWRDHYLKVRLWFFGIYVVFTFVSMFASWILMDTPLIHPYRIVQLADASFGIVALLSVNLRVHRVMAILTIMSVLAGQAIFRLLPGLA